ncbi:RBBP9/YdeN family alpha/beta hydrolase [Nocardioides insulae]|uniref:RBBP9/YdeN family alpha/beta hydrolase n=1 Tax=Nocardioides insulae TaxID=394734 RepID=UPI000424C5CC|nr:alpha/beta hydrolase [Nocardioides insulae]
MSHTTERHNPVRPRTFVIVPGLRGHVEDHWQTHLAARLPHVRVMPPGRPKDDLDGRVADLEDLIQQIDGPVTIVAHSAGVLTTVHWAHRYGTDRPTPVDGALLATPPDLAEELHPSYPSLAQFGEAGWLPIPRTPLPFPSILAASANDPLGDPERVRSMAEAWGSRLVEVGSVGHLNPAAGYGEWPLALQLLDELALLQSGPVRANAS